MTIPPTSTESAETEAQEPGEKTPWANARRRGGVRTSSARGRYEERVSQLNDDDIALLVQLYTMRIATRLQLAQSADPIAYAYPWLPEEWRPSLTDEEIAVRKRKAYRATCKHLTACELLGFVTVLKQRRQAGSTKDAALRCYGTEKPGGGLNSRADTIILSQAGLRFVKNHLGLPSEAPPLFSYLQVAASRVPHQLIASELYVCLCAMAELGKLEVSEYQVEKSWGRELEKKEGAPARGEPRRADSVRTDVYLRVAPAGQPELVDEICVECDRGSQKTSSHIPPSGANPTQFVIHKIAGYYSLARRLGRQLNLVFVVPEWGTVTPANRAKSHWRLLKEERNRWRLGLPKDTPAEKVDQLIPVRHVELPEPTPREFVIWLARYLEEKGRAAGEAETLVAANGAPDDVQPIERRTRAPSTAEPVEVSS